MQICKVVSYGRLFLIILWNRFLVLLYLLLHFVDHGVVNGLVRLLIGESEPSSVEFTFLKALSTSVELSDSQQYHRAWLLNGAQRYLDFLVVVNLQHGIPHIIQVSHCRGLILPAVWIDFGQLLSFFVEDNRFWIVFGNRRFVEWVVGSGEAQLCDSASDLAMEKLLGPIAVFNGV